MEWSVTAAVDDDFDCSFDCAEGDCAAGESLAEDGDDRTQDEVCSAGMWRGQAMSGGVSGVNSFRLTGCGAVSCARDRLHRAEPDPRGVETADFGDAVFGEALFGEAVFGEGDFGAPVFGEAALELDFLLLLVNNDATLARLRSIAWSGDLLMSPEEAEEP